MLVLCITALVHRIINDPLRQFPGPVIARFSNILHSYWFLSGRQPYHILKLHEKYGPVVRLAPNELSFNSSRSWKDIYGHRQGHRVFVKSEFYDGGSFADQAHSIVSERDVSQHAIMRRYLSHAFSDRALKEQEYLVAEVVDELIEQLHINASGPEGSDLVMWFNLCTFDIIGSLAFGETFGGLKSAKFHFWIRLVTGALRQGALADTFSRFPALAWLFKKFMPNKIEKLVQDTRSHEAHTMNLIQKRLQMQTERPDFLTRILEHRDSDGVSDIQLAAHASDFVTAGSETTATCLSCVFYYLLKTPEVLRKLQDEIRSAFKSYSEIEANSAQRLEYLHAVALEAMRVYAPLPFALPRVVPPGGDTVDGHMIPAGVIVSTNPIAAGLSSANFEKPMKFAPERWIGANKKDVLEAVQPFSLGPRGCLGRNLAWIELSTIISKMLWTFDLELIDKTLDWHRDSRMATLWQKPELKVRVTRRFPGD